MGHITATREEAEANPLVPEEKWGGKYLAAIKSWQNNWEELATFFDYPKEVRRLIYTTNIWRDITTSCARC